MKNHESESVNELILKIINLRKEYNIKDDTTATEIYHKLKKGSIYFLGQRFTWNRPEYIDIQTMAGEISDAISKAVTITWILKDTIQLQCGNSSDIVQKHNGEQLVKLLSQVYNRLNELKDNINQLESPLIKIKKEI